MPNDATNAPSLAAFVWDDPFLLEAQLTEDERMLRDAAAAFAQDRLAPRVLKAYAEETVEPEIFSEMGAAGLLGGGAQFIGLSHDDPDVTPVAKIRYDACVPVDDGFRAEGEIGVQTIAGGAYAVTTHHGPYSDLKDTYAALCGQWLPRSGWRFRDTPCFEIYLNDPEGTEPEELLTDIYLPLEERR